ncbi:MAG: hypothetical protein JWM86_542 [Thermoleophilia bacterium]|nr:hypothetical protein [Thermoleophilia bacterium]
MIGLAVDPGTTTTTLDQVQDAGPVVVFDDEVGIPYGAVGIDEDVAWKVTGVREVTRGARRPTDSRPPRPRPPVTLAQPGDRLVEVHMRVRNRSGATADPACGLAGFIGMDAIMVDDDAIADILEAPFSAGTYLGSCGNGIPDGAAGDIVAYFGIRGDDRMLGTRNSYGSGKETGVTDDSGALNLMLDKPR